METLFEGPIVDSDRPAVERFVKAVESGWPSAALAKAFAHVGIVNAETVIFFEMYELDVHCGTIACDPYEPTEYVKQRAHDLWRQTRQPRQAETLQS